MNATFYKVSVHGETDVNCFSELIRINADGKLVKVNVCFLCNDKIYQPALLDKTIERDKLNCEPYKLPEKVTKHLMMDVYNFYQYQNDMGAFMKFEIFMNKNKSKIKSLSGLFNVVEDYLRDDGSWVNIYNFLQMKKIHKALIK